MALTAQQIEEQKKQAEELLFSGPQTLGFAKGLFFGHFNAALLNPYPHVRLDEQSRVCLVAEVLHCRPVRLLKRNSPVAEGLLIH